MNGVAEGIEDGGELIGDVLGNLEGIEGGKYEVFGERARPIHPDPFRVSAQVSPARPAVSAEAASDMAFARNTVAGRQTRNFLTHCDDFTDVLVSHVHGDRYRLGGPVVPLPDMDIGAA